MRFEIDVRSIADVKYTTFDVICFRWTSGHDVTTPIRVFGPGPTDYTSLSRTRGYPGSYLLYLTGAFEDGK